MGPIDRLHDYLDEIATRRFEWGKHDCFTYTNEAWRRMYGRPWADPLWSSGYLTKAGHPYTLQALSERFGYATLADALQGRLRAVTGTPPRGALVTAHAGEGRWRVGLAFGISAGTRAAFLSSSGLLHLPIDQIKEAWHVLE